MKKEILLLGWLVFMPLACSSAADEPQEDYNLLNLLDVDALDTYFWSGKTTHSTCSNPDNPGICQTLKDIDQGYGADNLTLLFSNPVLLEGTLTAMVAHPSNGTPTAFSFSVKGNLNTGYETGNGISRLLTLSATPNTVTSNGVQATLQSFQADVLEDGLSGTMTLSFPGSTTTVVYSYNIKSH